jgi:hypothetical protein
MLKKKLLHATIMNITMRSTKLKLLKVKTKAAYHVEPRKRGNKEGKNKINLLTSKSISQKKKKKKNQIYRL